MFNSLKYAKKLEEVGFTREQAETHVMIMTEVMESTFATQQDMKDLSAELRQEMKDLSAELRQEMKDLSAGLHNEFKSLGELIASEFRARDLNFEREIVTLENRLLVKLGGLIVFATTLLTFLKLWGPN